MASKVGLFGATGVGNNQDIDTAPVSLKLVEIWSTDSTGGRINAISFTYVDSSGNETRTSEWGKSTGFNKHAVPIPSNGHVTRLSGTLDNNGVKSLTIFTSDGTKNGPFGDPSAGMAAFDIPVVSSAIVAFFARSGEYLNAVGAYVVPALP